MKVALVCDDLIQHGGHERVIMDFCELFPDAPLYSIYASKNWQKACKQRNIKLVTSFVQKLPFFEKLSRYYAPFMFHIFGIQSFDFSEYDLVISLSSRYAHGIITKPQTLHICYMSTPGRMFWESADYFKQEQYGKLNLIKFLARPFLAIPLSLTRLWDYTAAQRVDYFLCNSQTTKQRIRKYYNRDSKIIYPSIDVKEFSNQELSDEKYYLIITRLASWKRVDIAINACKDLALDLKIIGTGPNEDYLKKLASKCNNISFLGFVSDEAKLACISKCTALINTQMEDFGIVPLEVMASGKPVIAFGKGGVLETILPGKTGEFFLDQSPESLKEVLKNFDSSRYLEDDCRMQATRFDKKQFNTFVKEFIDSVYLSS